MVQNKRRKNAILVLTIFIIVHAYLIVSKQQPYSGIEASVDSHNNLIVKQIRDSGWAHKTNILQGDIIIKIDGEESKYFNPQIVRRAQEITVKRDDTVSYYQMQNNELSDITHLIYIPGIFSTLIVVLSYFIYKKHSQSANYLIGFFMGASISFFASTESGRGDMFGVFILTLSFSLGTFFFINFIFSIFQEKGIFTKRKKAFLTTNKWLCTIIIIINLVNQLFLSKTPMIYTQLLMLIYFCFVVLYSIVLFISSYLKYRYSYHEPFPKWMLVIQIVAFGPFIFFYAFPFILGLPTLNVDITVLFLFCIPLGYTYLIVTKQLLDINFILNRIFYYSVLSLVPAIIVSFMIVSTVNTESHSFSGFIQVFLLIFVLNIIFLLLKERIDFSFRNQLFKDKSNLTQSIDQFTKRLSSIMKEDELITYFVNEIVSTLSPTSIFLVGYNVEKSSFESKIVYGDNNQLIIDKKMKWLIQTYIDDGLFEHQNTLGIRLYKKDKEIVYLWIGHKRNNTTFNINEKTWIITVTKYVRLVYENLHTISGIVSSLRNENHANSVPLSRFLFQLAEKERRRLASDLHDSALQDQIVWYRRLEGLLNENLNLPKDVHSQLLKIKNGMLDVINQIRSTCNELRPNLLLEGGLVKSLTELFSQLQTRVQYQLDYEFERISETFEDFNTTLSIYRILQELLNNADKHSEATHVSVKMWEESKNIYIDYRDNGIGLNSELLQMKKDSLGLSGLKERIFSLNGEVNFISEIGEGLQVQITLPR